MFSNCSYSYSKLFVTHSVFYHKTFLLFLQHCTALKKNNFQWNVKKKEKENFEICVLNSLIFLTSLKAMAPHSSTLAWKIPWTEEPGRLQSIDGVTKSRIQLSDFTFTCHFHTLEKEMATYSSVLAWRIPRIGEPGGLLSMGLHRVRHNWSALAAAAGQWFSLGWEDPLEKEMATYSQYSCLENPMNRWSDQL